MQCCNEDGEEALYYFYVLMIHYKSQKLGRIININNNTINRRTFLKK